MTRDTINQIYSSIEISGYIWLITSAAIKEFKDITVISPTLKAYIFLSISLKIHNPAKKNTNKTYLQHLIYLHLLNVSLKISSDKITYQTCISNINSCTRNPKIYTSPPSPTSPTLIDEFPSHLPCVHASFFVVCWLYGFLVLG